MADRDARQGDAETAAALDRARALWREGAWADLAALSADGVEENADFAELLLYKAAAHFHFGNRGALADHLARARRLGTAPEAERRLLVAGLSNSLGRAAVALGDTRRAERHFADAVPGGPDGRARRLRETVALGLLPDGAKLVQAGVEALKQAPDPSQARIEVLESELKLLKHEFSISLQKGQLYRSGAGAAPAEGGALDPGALVARSQSQIGQDLWVLERTGYKRGGFFVEFGATDGVVLSNSYLLETDFGWTGICAEPNPEFFERLKNNRSCIVSNDCIAGETGREVEFILADAYGGFVEYAGSDAHREKRRAYAETGRTMVVKTISLVDFLIKHSAPRRIDYLSIDTEGSEYEILAAFPFDEWDIRLITVEHNFTPMRAQIRALLESRGYACTEASWDDWYEKHPGSG